MLEPAFYVNQSILFDISFGEWETNKQKEPLGIVMESDVDSTNLVQLVNN